MEPQWCRIAFRDGSEAATSEVAEGTEWGGQIGVKTDYPMLQNNTALTILLSL